jgi:hypothetical protein
MCGSKSESEKNEFGSTTMTRTTNHYCGSDGESEVFTDSEPEIIFGSKLQKEKINWIHNNAT